MPITETDQKRDALCQEQTAPPNGMVVWGASGDLAHRKLFPSLYELYIRELMPEKFYLLGCGRTDYSDPEFRESVKKAVTQKLDTDENKLNDFLEKFYFITGDYSDQKYYQRIKQKIDELDKKHKIKDIHIFYLSVPPTLYTTIVDNLRQSRLSCTDDFPTECTRLVIEKPFGKDYESARKLNSAIKKCFYESQVYRIDHYLGKETVQNILMFRFANVIFEPIWNRNYIDNIQITIAESVGLGHRAGYYEKSGALRDMIQNHMLQLLALVAMEPPSSFEPDSIRDSVSNLLREIRPFDLNDKWNPHIIRGQYGQGKVGNKKVNSYREEENTDPDSNTETFVAAKMFIDNWRFQGVPFFVRTGKRLAAKRTEIAIIFKKVPHSIFFSAGLQELPNNTLVLRIQPNEGFNLSFQAKRPGAKLCMTTLNMGYNYDISMPEAYQRLVLDCMIGDQTLFTRYDTVELQWKLIDPVLKAWQKGQPAIYPAGVQSFPEADKITTSESRKWKPFL